ncbi:MAG TPA: DUF433 domain-containing protein [Gemmatales bacterium]|nr:DUF433 domain-containing protein [Gemmatales bacterium]
MPVNWKERITLNPQVLAGKPTIRGLRISVEQVLRALGSGQTEAELLREYPDLQASDLAACQAYAADLVALDRVYPLHVSH